MTAQVGGGPPTVVVVGSINMDLVVQVSRLPAPGETVSGGDLFRNPGGKGANQAVAASRLGQRVAIVGCVGDDDTGHALMEALRADGVDTSNLRALPGVPSGTALIAVSPSGENQIVVSPGANARLAPDHVTAAAGLLEAAAVTLIQLEIPMPAVEAAVRLAGGTVVLNPAPAATVPPHVIGEVDVAVPNRVELARLADAPVPRSIEEVVRLAEMLPVNSVVVTLGTEGAVVVEGSRSSHVPAVPVRAVDSTAAGDAFCAALADAVVRGESLESAARWGARVAAVACTRRGAQASLPTRAEALEV